MQGFIKQAKRKKGMMGLEDVKSIILLAAGAFAVLALIGLFSKAFAEKATPAACHDSLVYTAALMKQIPAGEQLKKWPTACKTKEKVIEDKEKERAIDETIRLMGDCWYAMGLGEIRPFDTDVYLLDNKCFICYIASFPKLEGTISSSDIIARMATLTAPDGKKYSEYLQTGAIEQLLGEPITNAKDYAILYSNKQDLIGLRDQGVTVWELNKVRDRCDEVKGEAS